MILDILCGAIVLSLSWKFYKKKSRDLAPPLPYTIHLCTINDSTTQILTTFHSTSEIEYIEQNLAELTTNPIFLETMKECNINFIEVHDDPILLLAYKING